jgi:hypothetical protein
VLEDRIKTLPDLWYCVLWKFNGDNIFIAPSYNMRQGVHQKKSIYPSGGVLVLFAWIPFRYGLHRFQTSGSSNRAEAPILVFELKLDGSVSAVEQYIISYYCNKT